MLLNAFFIPIYFDEPTFGKERKFWLTLPRGGFPNRNLSEISVAPFNGWNDWAV
jgi:hypothetical protein